MPKNSPELEIDLGPNESSELGREKVIQSVFKDYRKLLRSAIEQNWEFKSSKLYEWGQVTLSHFEHITHGVQVLFTLYRNLPEEHFFVDESTLRDTIAMFMIHDYHKLRDDSLGEEEFDISKNEIRLFSEKLNVSEVSDVDVETLRAVASAHHKTSDKAKINEIPLEYLDEFYFVLLADAIASSEDIDHVLSTCRNRVQGALNGQYSVFGHTLESDDMGEFGNIVNRAVKNVLEEMGFITLKPFTGGCSYVQPGDVELDKDSLNKRILEEVRTTAREARDDYGPEDTVSNIFKESNHNTQYYKVGYTDILLMGIRKSIEGIVKKGLIESIGAVPNENADEGDSFAVKCQTKDQIDLLKKYVDMDFHTDTRRVEGVSKIVHTMYLFTLELIESKTDNKERNIELEIESDEEWATDRLMAVLKLFGLYENEEHRKTVKEARENAQGKLSNEGDYGWWYYKYIIGQFVYEEYFEGYPRQKMTNRLTDIIMDNLEDFASIEEVEDEIIGDVRSELASWLGINVKFHPSRGEEFLLSEVRDNGELVEKYLQNPNKEDCEICSWGTTSSSFTSDFEPTPLLLGKVEEESLAEIETNVKGTGERETTTVQDKDTTICFACQLRVFTNRGNIEDWGGDNVIYAHTQDYYGYNPISEWLFKEFISTCKNSNTGELELDTVGEDILNLTPPEPFENFMSWEKPTLIKTLTSVEGAYKPDTSFGGGPVVISKGESDRQKTRNSIAVAVSAAVYSGTRLHISQTPLSLVEDNTGELVSMSSNVSIVYPTFGKSIKIEDSLELISETITEEGEVECSVPSGAF